VTERIRVLVVEDQRVLAEALSQSLDIETDIEVVGSARNAERAIQMARDLRPDVVVMDHHLPDRDGIAATRQIHRDRPGVPVVMLTGDTSDDVLLAALNAGMSGFLLKDDPFGDLVASVRRAAAGEMVWPADRLARLLAQGPRGSGGGTSLDLTARERDVLRLMCDGHDNKTIATHLGLSLTTVRGYVQDVLRKLGAHSKLEAVVIATRSGILNELGVRPD
jgi:DNA-binding NarL/FixJ family response regulator